MNIFVFMEEINASFKFKISKIEDYDKLLGFRAYYKSVRKAVDYYSKKMTEEQKVVFQKLVNHHGDGRDMSNNRGDKKEPYQSLKNVNSILCFFFNQNLDKKFDIDDIKKFLNSLDFFDMNKQNDVNAIQCSESFDCFIDLVKPHIPIHFRKYDYKIDLEKFAFIVNKNKKTIPGKTNTKRNIWLLATLIFATSIVAYIILNRKADVINVNAPKQNTTNIKKQTINNVKGDQYIIDSIGTFNNNH